MESGPTSLDSKRKLNMSLDDILKESKVAKTTVLRPPGHEPKPKLRTNSIDAAGEFMERSDQSFPTNRSRGSRVTPYPSMRQSGSTLPKNCSSVLSTRSHLPVVFPTDIKVSIMNDAAQKRRAPVFLPPPGTRPALRRKKPTLNTGLPRVSMTLDQRFCAIQQYHPPTTSSRGRAARST